MTSRTREEMGSSLSMHYPYTSPYIYCCEVLKHIAHVSCLKLYFTLLYLYMYTYHHHQSNRDIAPSWVIQLNPALSLLDK